MRQKQIKMYFIMAALIVVMYNPSLSFAQGQSQFQGPSIRSQVAKILLSSLGGAVLGISTLSFYDRPQDHLSNVAVGGTVGAVLGSIYVTKESLDHDSMATLEDGGRFDLLVGPKNDRLLLSWSVAF